MLWLLLPPLLGLELLWLLLSPLLGLLELWLLLGPLLGLVGLGLLLPALLGLWLLMLLPTLGVLLCLRLSLPFVLGRLFGVPARLLSARLVVLVLLAGRLRLTALLRLIALLALPSGWTGAPLEGLILPPRTLSMLPVSPLATRSASFGGSFRTGLGLRGTPPLFRSSHRCLALVGEFKWADPGIIIQRVSRESPRYPIESHRFPGVAERLEAERLRQRGSSPLRPAHGFSSLGRQP